MIQSAPSPPEVAMRTESLGRRFLVDATGHRLAALAVVLIALVGSGRAADSSPARRS